LKKLLLIAGFASKLISTAHEMDFNGCHKALLAAGDFFKPHDGLIKPPRDNVRDFMLACGALGSAGLPLTGLMQGSVGCIHRHAHTLCSFFFNETVQRLVPPLKRGLCHIDGLI
jgi:hypothetical protein